MKTWCDKYNCPGEVKRGTVTLTHKHMVITSNYSIEEMFEPDQALITAVKRRCIVHHLTEVRPECEELDNDQERKCIFSIPK